MRPAFLGMNIARSALYTNQQQLDITSHNIANASVEGYSRQRLDLKAAPDLYNIGGTYPGGLGQGVWADQVERLRDSLLDRDYRRQQEELKQAETARRYLDRMESVLGELGDSGLQQQVERFFDAWQELSARPEDLSLRKVLLAEAETMAGLMREIDAEALALQQTSQIELRQSVARVNEISRQLAELNPEIIKRSGIGENPSDLLDERDRLLDELSGFARIDVQTD
ncbi:MAG: flagellar hook-associated protein FlgK, partial [Candidatus Melainabacteria bacterium HGW-Melainabacteria-1]